jgi:hypothetical protein
VYRRSVCDPQPASNRNGTPYRHLSTPKHTQGPKLERHWIRQSLSSAVSYIQDAAATEGITSALDRLEQLPSDCSVRTPLRAPSFVIYRTERSCEMLQSITATQKMLTESEPEVARRSCCARKPIESNGDRCGQESEEESPQRIYSGGRETIEGTLESQNTSRKAYEVDETIRGFASAKGIGARNWSRPSAIELNPTPLYETAWSTVGCGPFSFSLRDQEWQSVISFVHIPDMEQRFPSDSFTKSLHTFRSAEARSTISEQD